MSTFYGAYHEKNLKFGLKVSFYVDLLSTQLTAMHTGCQQLCLRNMNKVSNELTMDPNLKLEIKSSITTGRTS